MKERILIIDDRKDNLETLARAFGNLEGEVLTAYGGKEAIEILTEFPKKYPDSDNLGAVFNTLGGIYFRSEKYESAITSFKAALDQPLKPDLRRQVMSNLIKAYTFVNFWDAALALAREYIETYPEAEDAIDKKNTYWPGVCIFKSGGSGC